jgi:hypothetical protein
MKTKTATIRTNHIFGSKNSYCTDVLYRGRLLVSFTGDTAQNLHDKGRAWAYVNGFTKTNNIFG